MMQNTNMSKYMFGFSHGVCCSHHQTDLEGERDYGQQRFATCTFLRSCFRRGVAHIVQVVVEIQGVRRLVLVKFEKWCTRVREADLRRPNQSHIVYFIVW